MGEMGLKGHMVTESEVPKKVQEVCWGNGSTLFYFLVSSVYVMVVKPIKTNHGPQMKECFYHIYSNIRHAPRNGVYKLSAYKFDIISQV